MSQRPTTIGKRNTKQTPAADPLPPDACIRYCANRYQTAQVVENMREVETRNVFSTLAQELPELFSLLFAEDTFFGGVFQEASFKLHINSPLVKCRL